MLENAIERMKKTQTEDAVFRGKEIEKKRNREKTRVLANIFFRKE